MRASIIAVSCPSSQHAKDCSLRLLQVHLLDPRAMCRSFPRMHVALAGLHLFISRAALVDSVGVSRQLEWLLGHVLRSCAPCLLCDRRGMTLHTARACLQRGVACFAECAVSGTPMGSYLTVLPMAAVVSVSHPSTALPKRGLWPVRFRVRPAAPQKAVGIHEAGIHEAVPSLERLDIKPRPSSGFQASGGTERLCTCGPCELPHELLYVVLPWTANQSPAGVRLSTCTLAGRHP